MTFISSKTFLLLFVVIALFISNVWSNDWKNQPSGACCLTMEHYHDELSTECIEFPMIFCLEHHGDFMGEFSRCRPVNAHPCTGACCTSHGCIEVVEARCIELNGEFTKAGARCNNTGNFCPSNITGACCYKWDVFEEHDFGTCVVETFLECYSGYHHPSGDFWTDGTDCSIPGICPFNLVPYLEPLPTPQVLKPYKGKSGCEPVEEDGYHPVLEPQREEEPVAEYMLPVKSIHHKYYPFFPNPQVAFGYGGTYPGPTIETCRGVPISVKYINELPVSPHPLGFDTCVHGSDYLENVCFTSVHLHGGHQPTEYDGWPEALIQPGQSYDYYYQNLNRPTMLFYHDHALGITRKNVMMGLVGLYFIRSPDEPKLPTGDYEISLVLQDKSFTYHNMKVDLYYPPTYQITVPFPSDDFTGTVGVVNGVVNPYKEVYCAQYRFRVVNGANFRTWMISFVKVIHTGAIVDIPFLVIGSDQGFIAEPKMATALAIAAAERADIIFDFTHFRPGDRVWLINAAPIPFPNGNARPKNFTAIDSDWDIQQLVEFRVVDNEGTRAPYCEIPHHLLDLDLLPVEKTRTVRSFLVEQQRSNWTHTCPHYRWLLKSFNVPRDPSWGFHVATWDARDYIKDHLIPLLGSIEIWEIWNPTNETHPIHLHGYPFQILSSRKIKMYKNIPETMEVTDEHIPLQPTETAWKDTIQVHPHSMTSIIIPFIYFTGKFPFHCHMLEHEDHEMMRQFRVIDPSHPCQIVSGSRCGNSICEAANGENCINCPFDCMGNHYYCCGWDGSHEHPHANFIGCGPMEQLHFGQTRACQRLDPGTGFLLDVTCRSDFVDRCCYEHGHCGW